MDRGAWRAMVHRVKRVRHDWSSLVHSMHVSFSLIHFFKSNPILFGCILLGPPWFITSLKTISQNFFLVLGMLIAWRVMDIWKIPIQTFKQSDSVMLHPHLPWDQLSPTNFGAQGQFTSFLMATLLQILKFDFSLFCQVI